MSDASRQVVARYFEMWNTGDSAAAPDILSSDWVDHAHPEVTGPQQVMQSVDRLRASRPDLRFQIDSLLDHGDLVAAVGSVDQGDAARPASRLVWLVRVADGKMAEMWTYHGKLPD